MAIGDTLLSSGVGLLDNIIGNATNKKIADENRELQQQMFEYNKGLQQKIFEREDTSYQRTAQDMLNAGLNPLQMQGTNGAGEAIASDTPQTNFQYRPTGQDIIGALQAFTGLRSTFDQLETNKLQRDALQLENDKKKYDLILDGLKKGIKINFNGENEIDDETFDKWYDLQKKKLSEESLQSDYNQRNMQHDIDTGKYPSDSQIDSAITSILDWLTSGRGEEAWYKLTEENPLVQTLGDVLSQQYEIKIPKKKDKKTKTTHDENGNSHTTGKF